jgi:hypothetical protein
MESIDSRIQQDLAEQSVWRRRLWRVDGKEWRIVQPTDVQVQQSLLALERSDVADDAVATGDRPGHGSVVPVDGVPVGLVDVLLSGSDVRFDRVADARRRLRSGAAPTDEDLASRVVGRLVCDRLR